MSSQEHAAITSHHQDPRVVMTNLRLVVMSYLSHLLFFSCFKILWESPFVAFAIVDVTSPVCTHLSKWILSCHGRKWRAAALRYDEIYRPFAQALFSQPTLQSAARQCSLRIGMSFMQCAVFLLVHTGSAEYGGPCGGPPWQVLPTAWITKYNVDLLSWAQNLFHMHVHVPWNYSWFDCSVKFSLVTCVLKLPFDLICPSDVLFRFVFVHLCCLGTCCVSSIVSSSLSFARVRCLRPWSWTKRSTTQCSGKLQCCIATCLASHSNMVA